MRPRGEPGEGGLFWADQDPVEAHPPAAAPGRPGPRHQGPELPDGGEASGPPGPLQPRSRYPGGSVGFLWFAPFHQVVNLQVSPRLEDASQRVQGLLFSNIFISFLENINVS